jgi:hypothetical protein
LRHLTIAFVKFFYSWAISIAIEAYIPAKQIFPIVNGKMVLAAIKEPNIDI